MDVSGRFFLPKTFSAVNESNFGSKAILSIADRGITRVERPVDFVSACSAAAMNGAGSPTAFRSGDDDTEVSAAPGAGAGEVDGHSFRLAL